MAANFVWLWMRLLLDQHQNGLEWLALVVLFVVTGLVLVLLLGQGGHVLMETVGGVHTVLVTNNNSIFFMIIIINILLLLLSFHYGGVTAGCGGPWCFFGMRNVTGTSICATTTMTRPRCIVVCIVVLRSCILLFVVLCSNTQEKCVKIKL